MNLESKKINLKKSDKEVFLWLEDVKNFEKLMPSSVAKFEVIDEKSFVFALSGMPEIALELKEKTPFSSLVFGATKESKVPFTLRIEITQVSENEAFTQFLFEGNFNPMMAMMVKSPILKLIETMAEKTTLLE